MIKGMVSFFIGQLQIIPAIGYSIFLCDDKLNLPILVYKIEQWFDSIIFFVSIWLWFMKEKFQLKTVLPLSIVRIETQRK